MGMRRCSGRILGQHAKSGCQCWRHNTRVGRAGSESRGAEDAHRSDQPECRRQATFGRLIRAHIVMGTPPLWIGFNLFVLASIALDLGVFNRRLHKVSLREAGFFSLLWVALSILFGLGVLHYSGKQAGLEFFTGYLIEKALSVDNLFLFLVIFRTFAIDDRLQHRMLECGILGALVMRGLIILAGAELIERFSSVLY